MERLKECTTPQEYIDMYKCGESCMSIAKENTCQVGWDLWTKRGLWSSMWYAWLPKVRGLLLEIDGKDVARGFMYGDDCTLGPIYYGNDISGGWRFTKKGAFPINGKKIGETQEIFYALMWDKGIRKRIMSDIKMTEPFKVPGVLWEGQYYCPLPHVDFVAKPFSISFDEEDHGFIFDKPKEDAKIIKSTYDYPMWLNSKLNAPGPHLLDVRIFNEKFRSNQDGNIQEIGW